MPQFVVLSCVLSSYYISVEVDRIIDCRDRTTEVPLTDAEMDELDQEEEAEVAKKKEEVQDQEEEGRGGGGGNDPSGLNGENSSSNSRAAATGTIASAAAGLEGGDDNAMEDDLAFLEQEAAGGGSSGSGKGKGLSLGGGKGASVCRELLNFQVFFFLCERAAHDCYVKRILGVFVIVYVFDHMWQCLTCGLLCTVQAKP